jgi:enoyl-[acyl-carrier protein] reductase I
LDRAAPGNSSRGPDKLAEATVILDGKRILVTGVIDRRSIAYAIAEEAQRQGAELVLTNFGRVRRMTERAARDLPQTPDVLELDVTEPEHFTALAEQLEQRWGGLDGVVHAIAFAPPDAISGDFLATPTESALTAFEVSAFSLKSIAAALLPLLSANKSPGSIVGLDFDGQLAWPSYDWMGVSKAALEAVARYLARDLGPHGVRVNLVAAGPIRTIAASSVGDFQSLVEEWLRRAPLGWDDKDTGPVAGAAVFLLSDLARAITGEIVHVDGGVHAMGGDLPGSPLS